MSVLNISYKDAVEARRVAQYNFNMTKAGTQAYKDARKKLNEANTVLNALNFYKKPS